jgi:CheY-like chemotaxis protein
MDCSEQKPRLDILLVEDDRDDATLLGIGITRSGVNIWLQTVPNPVEAIAYLQGEGVYAEHDLHPAPHLIVLDIKMPLMTGLEFLEWRRRSPAALMIPVVVLTGSDWKSDIKQALAGGIADYMVKPAAIADWEQIARKIWQTGLKLRGLTP